MKKLLLILTLMTSITGLRSQTLVTSMPEADDEVNAIVRSGNIVVVGGNFNNFGTIPRTYLAAFDATTGAVLPWNPTPDQEINCLLVAEGKLYVGGNFANISGQPRLGLAVYDLPGLNLISFGPSPSGYGGVLDLKLRNGKIYYNDYNSNWDLFIKRFDAITGSTDSWQTDLMSLTTQAYFDVLGDFIYVAGSFDAINNQYLYDGFARFSMNTGDVDTSYIYTFSSGAFLRDVAAHGNKIYVSGSYTTINGLSRKGAAEIDSAGNITPLDFHTSSSQNVSLFAQGTTMWMGGNSFSLGGGSSYRMAQIKLSNGFATCWDIGATISGCLWVKTIYVSGDTVYAATSGAGVSVRNFNVFVGNPSYVSLGPDISITTGGSAIITASGTFQNFIWNTGATTSSITVTTPGVYWVSVSASSCTASDTIIVSLSTGITETVESIDVRVYPNPVSDQLHIQCEQCNSNIIVQVFDVTGRKCYESIRPAGDIILDVRDLLSGSYHLVLMDASGDLLHSGSFAKSTDP